MSLKELREQRAWSVGDLARAAGVAVETVATAETGTTRPQPGTVRKLAAVLNLEPTELAAQLSGRGASLATRLQRSTGARACAIPDCPEPQDARGWCSRHYQRWRKYGDPLAWRRAPPKPRPPSRRRTLEQRFWSHVSKHAGGCWLWSASVTAEGYGRFHLTVTREQKAHSLAYGLTHGPLPPGQVLVNQCGTRACVNPEHWAASTRKEVARGWHTPSKPRDGP
jgi:transcriptional regulator with XRE-family HTH domain